MDKTVNNYPLWIGLGVLTTQGGEPELIWRVDSTLEEPREDIDITHVTGDKTNLPIAWITVDPTTARLEFASNGVVHRVRELRESDGIWLSDMRMDLPITALQFFGSQGDYMKNIESLTAYATDDSPYVVALVYGNAVGRWLRVDEDWMLLSPTDNTLDDMQIITLDPERSEDYILLFDRNYVTVSDTEAFELSDSQ